MIYVVYPHHEGMVMTSDADYVELALINGALGAATWGEFLDALPVEERERLLQVHEEIFGNDILSSNRLDKEDDAHPEVLHRETSFRPESVPGYSDGDYPRWPAEMNSIVDATCREALEKFGNRHVGFMQTFWLLPSNRIPAVRAWLKKQGDTLERRPPPGE
jgi:hypothetical protein